jgi:tetratricopeptide (TPR) repeat protein
MKSDHETSIAGRIVCGAGALIALVVASFASHGMYVLPEMETVPTDRLIANLEKRLNPKPVESDRIRPGEEIQIWTWGLDHLHGNYTVGEDGFITLPERGRIKASGKTLAELRLDLNEGVNPATLNTKAIFPEQAWHQRKGRVLVGETAQLEYELARVLSIAASVKAGGFRTLKGGDRPFLGNGPSSEMPFDRARFREDGPVDYRWDNRPPAAEARRYRARAIQHYREALKLDSSHLPSHLGLAWCLDQQGDREAAEAAYRKTLELAWAREGKAEYIHEASFVEETGSYLLALLDPQKDAEEIKRIRGYTEAISRKGRSITPIVIPLVAGDALEQLVDPHAAVRFDLDGRGLPRTWGWIRPSAAWLVFDPNRAGRITSGLQLFGTTTFWVFWPSGYAALASLDDSGDGWLKGGELNGLALWQDLNGNAVSEPGEVQPVQDHGITALGCRGVPHPSGIEFSPDGVVFEDGRREASYDWILRLP